MFKLNADAIPLEKTSVVKFLQKGEGLPQKKKKFKKYKKIKSNSHILSPNER